MIERVAQTVEMHLIEDHTRQQDAPASAAIDSAQELHWAVLPYAHPDEYLAFLERQKASEAGAGPARSRSSGEQGG